eukprot:CAMPEP_0170739078 /NCGR_PEP_ID=MMETSP0437-20130122/4975_1 /TAXON_ID=0 /ORGANISM="Sexangularia sp." /LENGTH=33 /DNA_ID= /DNA_START= /DNA_END= /DNA_ORIENTATION=
MLVRSLMTVKDKTAFVSPDTPLGDAVELMFQVG